MTGSSKNEPDSVPAVDAAASETQAGRAKKSSAELQAEFDKAVQTLRSRNPAELDDNAVREALEMLQKRYALEIERIDKIDTKLSALLAGLIATLAFLLDHASWRVSAIAMLLLVPIAMLGWAVRGRDYGATPKPVAVLTALNKDVWRKRKIQILTDTATVTNETNGKNASKVRWMNRAIILAFILVLVASVLKIYDLSLGTNPSHAEDGLRRADRILSK